MPTRQDIEMEAESRNTDLDFLLRLSNPTDPAHVQSNNLKYSQAFIKFSHSVRPCRPIVKQKGALFKPTGMMMTPGWNILHTMMPCSNELQSLSVLFITINKDPVLLRGIALQNSCARPCHSVRRLQSGAHVYRSI